MFAVASAIKKKRMRTKEMNRCGSILSYDGYTGTKEYDDERGVWFGKVNTEYTEIFYESETEEGLYEEFCDNIDGYEAFLSLISEHEYDDDDFIDLVDKFNRDGV